MYLKLFAVMTISLEVEMLTWLIKDGDKLRFYIQDLWTLLQAVLIFLIFVCNDSIFKKMNHKFFKNHPKLNNSYRQTTTQTFKTRSIYRKPSRLIN